MKIRKILNLREIKAQSGGVVMVHHHLGLGDHLCLNGVTRFISKEMNFGKIYVACQSKYKQLVDRMFDDNHKIVPVDLGPPSASPTEQAAMLFLIDKGNYPAVYFRLGYEQYPLVANKNPTWSCDRCFYYLAGLPYLTRWEWFSIRRDRETEMKLINELGAKSKFAFVHDDKARGFEIKPDTDLPVIRNDPTKPFFDYALLLEEAEEIHCIESSFRCFIEGLACKAKRFVHYKALRAAPGEIGTKYQWEVK